MTIAHTEKILGWIQKMMHDAINDVIYTLDRFANHPKGLQLAVIVATLIKKPSLATIILKELLKYILSTLLLTLNTGLFLWEMAR